MNSLLVLCLAVSALTFTDATFGHGGGIVGGCRIRCQYGYYANSCRCLQMNGCMGIGCSPYQQCQAGVCVATGIGMGGNIAIGIGHGHGHGHSCLTMSCGPMQICSMNLGYPKCILRLTGKSY